MMDRKSISSSDTITTMMESADVNARAMHYNLSERVIQQLVITIVDMQYYIHTSRTTIVADS